MVEKKLCSHCAKLIPISNFYKRSGVKSGLDYICKEHRKINNKKYVNKDKRRIRQCNWAKKAHKNARIKIYELLGNQCIKCGFSDTRALDVDHIENDGNKSKRITNALILLRKIQMEPERFQILCRNCNWIKNIENSEKYK